MSSRNNLIPRNYDSSFKPTSFKSIYASYDHQCTKDYPESMNNAYSLTVPFMNSISIPNYPNPYSVDINKEKKNISRLNSFSEYQSRYDLESSRYAPFKPISSQNNDSLELSANQKKDQVFESFSSEQREKNSNVNTFPMAWTCYKDKQSNNWKCPLRGDKP